MRKHSEGKAVIYLLFLVLGIGFGLIAGGEFMRRLSTGQLNNIFGKNSMNIDTVTTESNSSLIDSDSNLQAQENIINTRRNAIVAATRKVAPCVVGIVVTQIQVVRSPYQGDDFF